jgi:uncharacterized hydrophobic protein (TIGR00271 family)
MLHVQLVCDASRTRLLCERLAGLPGVHNLVVFEGAARQPPGDAAWFDLEETAANPVFRALRGLGLAEDGPVIVQHVDAALSGKREPKAAVSSTAGETAPVWELVEASIRGGAVYAPSFFILLAIAGLIGAVGILTNSQILIVGAMVVGPEYGAIIAVALGISRAERGVVRAGLLALAAGFGATIVLTLAFGLAVRAAGQAPELFLRGVRPVSDLINSPNAFSVVVAILAGIVGVVSLTQARAGALIGVFISVTTIPAASDVGVSVAFGSWHEAGGSVLQLLLNVVVLIVVGAAGLSAQRAIWRRIGARRPLQPLWLCRRGRVGGSNLPDVLIGPVRQQRHVVDGEGPLPAGVTGEREPPAQDRPHAVPVAGEEADVDEQPHPPAREPAEIHLERRHDGFPAGDVSG